MPELGEVARIVHYLKKHVVGRSIAAVKAQDDPIVFGKAGTSAAAVQTALNGKRIVDAHQQGKYFWLEMNSQPHPLMHFGMSGWIMFSNDSSAFYKPAKSEESEWPPKFWKFILEMEGTPECHIAFVDARRLGRVRLIDAAGDQMRSTTPLKQNGPDPVLDRYVLTREWLAKKVKSKRVPIKSLLLDQANISGVGNWVGDEVLYQARIHPERYSHTLSNDQLDHLYDALIYVCKTAVDTLAEVERLPDDWLMHYRWNKGKSNTAKLPNGDKIVFVDVGGRTSAVVPAVQKKTDAATGDVAEDADPTDESDAEPEQKTEEPKKTATASQVPAKRARGRAKKEDDTDAPSNDKASKKQKTTKANNSVPRKKKESAAAEPQTVSNPRRSARLARS